MPSLIEYSIVLYKEAINIFTDKFKLRHFLDLEVNIEFVVRSC